MPLAPQLLNHLPREQTDRPLRPAVVARVAGAIRKSGNQLEASGPELQKLAGDSVSFPADRPHAYENNGSSEARYHNVILYER